MAAVAIWREAAAWLQTLGQPLWAPEALTESSVRAMARSGALVLGRAGGVPVACMQLTASDPVCWPEESVGAALYVHKLAVVRAQAGRGWPQALLDWAAKRAAACGAGAVRLDCAPRDALVRLYLGCGFRAVDGGPVDRAGYRVWRFERRVTKDPVPDV